MLSAVKLKSLRLKDSCCQRSEHQQKHDPMETRSSWGEEQQSHGARCERATGRRPGAARSEPQQPPGVRHRRTSKGRASLCK